MGRNCFHAGSQEPKRHPDITVNGVNHETADSKESIGQIHDIDKECDDDAQPRHDLLRVERQKHSQSHGNNQHHRLNTEHQRQEISPQRHLHHPVAYLWLGLSIWLIEARNLQNLPPDLSRGCLGQVCQHHIGVATRSLNIQLGKPQKPGYQRPAHTNCVHPVAASPSGGPKQQPALDLNHVVVHPNHVDPPLQPNHDSKKHDDEHRSQRKISHRIQEPAHGVNLRLVCFINPDQGQNNPQHDCLPEGSKGNPQQTRDNHTPAQYGGQGVQSVPTPVPKAGGIAQCRNCSHYRPARLDSATEIKWSRNSSASARGNPGIVTPVETAAVTRRNSDNPKRRLTGPRETSTSWSRP